MDPISLHDIYGDFDKLKKTELLYIHLIDRPDRDALWDTKITPTVIPYGDIENLSICGENFLLTLRHVSYDQKRYITSDEILKKINTPAILNSNEILDGCHRAIRCIISRIDMQVIDIGNYGATLPLTS